MAGPSVSTCPPSSSSAGTEPLGLMALKSLPDFVRLVPRSTVSMSKGMPASRNTIWGESEQAPGEI